MVGRYLSSRRQCAEQIKSINVRGNLLVTGTERAGGKKCISILILAELSDIFKVFYSIKIARVYFLDIKKNVGKGLKNYHCFYQGIILIAVSKIHMCL